MKEKNLSLELVKFLAVLTVANHWMAPLYVKYGFLASGGAIGDVLFFFASGYTLFLGRFGRFDNWYKRRIKRIFPTVIMSAALFSILNIRQLTIGQVICGGGLWFIKCIMLYYVVLYFVRKYAETKPLFPFLISGMVILIWFLFEDSSKVFMYGETYFKWSHYFLFMLMGAYLGNKTIEIKARPIKDATMFVLSLFVFYGLWFLGGKYEWIAHLQLLTLLPLMGIVVNIYKLCCAQWTLKMLRSKLGLCLRFVAGLCLEVYVVSDVVVDFMVGKLTSIFPLNLVVAFVMIVALAYITRCLARIFSQIFEKEDMDWKKVFEPVS